MKSPKEIKTGLENCTNAGNGCFEYPYSPDSKMEYDLESIPEVAKDCDYEIEIYDDWRE